ncbi:MAG: hypothetical protein ACRDZQ_16715, partial [Acidimicrobiales bacterium]
DKRDVARPRPDSGSKVEVVTARKYSASMDETVWTEAQAAARDEGVTLSRWLTQAAEQRLRRRRLDEAIASYEADHGRITEEEMAAWRAKVAKVRPGRRAGGQPARAS